MTLCFTAFSNNNFAGHVKCNMNFQKSLELKWLVGLKLIQLEQQKTTSFHYFNKKFKTNTLQGHKRYMKIFELEMNNLRVQILAAKMT